MTIAIVGAGFGGASLVCQLLTRLPPAASILWFNDSGRWGRGIAYGTPAPAHVLNVPAHNMGLTQDAPRDFVAWQAERAAASGRPPAEPDSYLPRALFGEYIDTRLQAADALHRGRLKRVADEVVGLARPYLPASADWALTTASGARHRARTVVLATGHFRPMAPRTPGLASLPADVYLGDPWDRAAIDQLPLDANIATLGAGLTMVDVLLQLKARGWRGRLTAVSRRGLWPHTHLSKPSAIALTVPKLRTACECLRWLRAEVAGHVQRGGDWQQVVDGMRPHTAKLWQQLPEVEQARLLRHGKAYWDTHRHRVAPEVGRLLAVARHAQELVHHAGRLQRAEPIERQGGRPRARLTWRLRHSGEAWRQDVDALINCTGAHSVWPRATTRLARALLSEQIVQPGPHGLGLRLGEGGQVFGGDGQLQPGLFALGPLAIGHRLESVAVPELRAQAKELADRLDGAGQT